MSSLPIRWLAPWVALACAPWVAASLTACGDDETSGGGASSAVGGSGAETTTSGTGATGATGGSGATGGHAAGSGGGSATPGPAIGVPEPEFGLAEQAPAPPSPWNSPTAGFYYVDESSASATDDGNEYGTPSVPRLTVPTELPAGAVVEIHGSYSIAHTSPRDIYASGTESAPVFIRGAAADDRPVLTGGWEVAGSYYVLENLEIDNASGLAILAPTDHAALRGSDVHGTPDGGGVGVVSWNGQEVSHVVVSDNAIHHNGDWQATYDQDAHGIAVGARVSYLWVLDNELSYNSGDGIQINAGNATNQPTTHHIYVARNVAHHNKQTGFWTKQAVDVVFSGNVSHTHRASDSSYGAGMGFQYAPERVWFIGNEVYDCEFGIAASSDSDLGTGTDSYFVGNLLHDIHAADGFSPNGGWSNAAMMLAGGVNRVIVANTIVGVDTGIASPSGGTFHIAGNIIADVTPADGSHIWLESGSGADGATMDHNLFGGTVRIRWGSSSPLDLAGLQAAEPGLCAGCLAADPGLVDAVGGNYRLADGSAAIDAAAADPVFAAFSALYCLDIAIDRDETPRPQGGAFDVGAYER